MLHELRQKIDEIDQAIIDLLEQRTVIVEKVGKFKATQNKNDGFIRAGREATMIRDLVQKATLFPKPAIAGIWRLIISASLSIEHNFSISVYSDNNHPEPYWLSREYFGTFIPISKSDSVIGLLNQVATAANAVGVIPLADLPLADQRWWRRLATLPSLRIFANIPLLAAGQRCIAIGKVMPEPTGDDHSFLQLTLHEPIKQPALAAAFAGQGLTAIFQGECTEEDGKHYHFIEVDDFIGQDDERIRLLGSALGNKVTVTLLGSYANPLVL